MDIKKNKYGFINERGSYGLDYNDESESSNYIISCVVVDEDKKDMINTESSFIEMDFLEEDNLSDEDLKWTMRKIALKKLVVLDLEVFIFIVNKERVKEEYGIKYKEDFIEFLKGILYTDIIAAYPHINLISNELDKKEFLREFDKYLIESHSPDLLGEYDVVFIKEKKYYPLSYISSFISDILFNKYEMKENLEEYEQCYEIIKEKVLPLSSWPKTPEEYIENLPKYIREEFDDDIAYNCIRIAFDFISNNGGTKNEAKYAQVLSLKYLLSVLLNYGENRYIYSEEIRKKLMSITGKVFTSHYFQARVIAPLRDNGILIATSKKGYKIPIKESEIVSFINKSSSVIKPMVERIKICRDSVLKATDNKVDVLDKDEYKYLKEIISIEGDKVLK